MLHPRKVNLKIPFYPALTRAELTRCIAPLYRDSNIVQGDRPSSFLAKSEPATYRRLPSSAVRDVLRQCRHTRQGGEARERQAEMEAC